VMPCSSRTADEWGGPSENRWTEGERGGAYPAILTGWMGRVDKTSGVGRQCRKHCAPDLVRVLAPRHDKQGGGLS